MKKGGTRPDKEAEQCKARLEEIVAMPLGALTEAEVLGFLAEREALETKLQEYEERRKERMEAERLEKERSEVEALIEKLNQSITPDKADDELLKLIAERQELEVRLAGIAGEPVAAAQTAVPLDDEALQEAPVKISARTEPADDVAIETPDKAVEMPTDEAEEKKVSAPEEVPVTVPVAESSEAAIETVDDAPVVVDHQEIGKEGIIVDPAEESGELRQYLEQLRGSTESLGILLQSIPTQIKASKTFMLKVAEIDPAYAMHYADAVLKQNEDFNMRVVNMPNRRNSGNVLAEMLPGSRTGQVVLAAVKHDYQNIRFALPDMKEYREMISIAKKGALEKVKALKDGADIALIIPKILQKDPEFMREAENLVKPPKQEEVLSDADSSALSHPRPVAPPVSDGEKSVWSIHHSGL